MRWVYDDGGRAAAGFKAKHASDCVCRAITIATGADYKVVYDALNKLATLEYMHKGRIGRSARAGKPISHANRGVHPWCYNKLLKALGWVWTPTMFVGQGCKVHLRDGELPAGRLIVKCSGHTVAVIDGVIHDTYDPSRDGTRCVYGWWSKP